MCVTSLLCGPWADLWPFNGQYCKRFSLYIKINQGWGIQRSGPTDPPKETAVKFAPTAPVASKFRLGNTRQFCFLFVILLQDAFAPRANQRSSISATFLVWSHRQNLGLNSALLLKGSDTARDSKLLTLGVGDILLLPLFSLSAIDVNGSKTACIPPRVCRVI